MFGVKSTRSACRKAKRQNTDESKFTEHHYGLCVITTGIPAPRSGEYECWFRSLKNLKLSTADIDVGTVRCKILASPDLKASQVSTPNKSQSRSILSSNIFLGGCYALYNTQSAVLCAVPLRERGCARYTMVHK